MANTLQQLLQLLTRDRDRPSRPFSADMQTAHNVLLNPYATDGERADMLNWWLQAHQPCRFGVIAAKARGIHHCFITEQDIRQSDEFVASKIEDSRKNWKRRASRGQNRSGFMLS